MFPWMGNSPFPESNCAIVCVPELPVNSSLGSSAVSFALTCILGTYSAHKFWHRPFHGNSIMCSQVRSSLGWHLRLPAQNLNYNTTQTQLWESRLQFQVSSLHFRRNLWFHHAFLEPCSWMSLQRSYPAGFLCVEPSQVLGSTLSIEL